MLGSQKTANQFNETMRSQFQKLKDKNTDFHKIYKQIEKQMQEQAETSILTLNEVNNFYTVIKEVSLREQNMTQEEFAELSKKIDGTLKEVMIHMMLHREQKLLQESYRQKELNLEKLKEENPQLYKEEQTEKMLKNILRCRGLMEAQYDIVKILVRLR